MKHQVVRIFAIWALLLCWLATDLSAQATRTTTRRRRATTGNVQTNNAAGNAIVNPATGNVVTPPSTAVDTAVPKRADNIFGSLEITPSLRNDNVVVRNLNKDRAPLAYQYIREDDAVWGRRLWEEIDVHEKINLPFSYSGEEGHPNLFSILVKAILDSQVVAFDPIDDRFTKIMSIDRVKEILVGKPDTIRVVDPVTGKESIQVVTRELNPHSVTRYRIKEDWVFDKQTSQLYVRIIGIAPMKAIYNQEDGSFRDVTPLFWLYYPDLRPILAKYDVYNPNNYMMRMSWEDLFELRYFHAYVVKEDNPFNRSIRDYEKDGVRRLLEGERIKNDIFNWEQNLWSY
ncbi:MAG: gliding motility protein GldN [Thermoflavifilum sp.]|nr:gliding motility protein GldN [Thermoflavifilum sp.]